jgi:hypothetical protein
MGSVLFSGFPRFHFARRRIDFGPDEDPGNLEHNYHILVKKKTLFPATEIPRFGRSRIPLLSMGRSGIISAKMPVEDPWKGDGKFKSLLRHWIEVHKHFLFYLLPGLKNDEIVSPYASQHAGKEI